MKPVSQKNDLTGKTSKEAKRWHFYLGVIKGLKPTQEEGSHVWYYKHKTLLSWENQRPTQNREVMPGIVNIVNHLGMEKAKPHESH